MRRLRTHLGAERLESDGDAVVISKQALVVAALSFEAVAEAAHRAGERTAKRALGTAELLAAEDGEEMRDAVEDVRLRLER